MNKVLLFLILGISVSSCKSDSKNLDGNEQLKAPETEIKKELGFSLYNASEFDLTNITIGLPDTVLMYQKLNNQSETNIIRVNSAYHYGFIRFYDNKDRKYYYQPIDYVGETPFEKGEMKFIIKSIDTTNRTFKLGFEYKNN